MDSIGNKLKALFALPFVIIISGYFCGSVISFSPSLTPAEMEIVNFTPEDLTIPVIHKATFTIDLSKPLSFAQAPAPAPDIHQAQLKSAPPPKLSSIIIGLHRKAALIDGTIMHEGDAMGYLVIKKIEPARVLVKQLHPGVDPNAPESNLWLYLENAP